jgi:hypothetical protein
MDRIVVTSVSLEVGGRFLLAHSASQVKISASQPPFDSCNT